MGRGETGTGAGRALGALVLVAALVACGPGGEPGGGPPTEPPTVEPAAALPVPGFGQVPVIIYVIDTLRPDRLGLYGYTRGTSPRIDALAAESVVFEQAQAPAPWTLPSVASLITSTFPCEHGVVVERSVLDPSLDTLGEVLQGAGYDTAAFSANVFVRMSDLHRGYGTYRRPTPERRLATIGRYLDGVGDNPFFAYVHTIEPHDPYKAPARLVGRFGAVTREERVAYNKAMIGYRKLTVADWRAEQPLGTTDNTSEQDRALARLDAMRGSAETMYDGSVALADEYLGRLVDLLRERGLWQRSLFILLSDHGEEMGDHGGWLHDQSVYDELMRVPLLIHFPEGRWAGERLSAPVSLVDIMPTILDVVGSPELCEGCRGTSLMPLLGGDGTVADGPRVTGMRWNLKKYYRPWKQGRGDINVVVRDGGLKAIWNLEPRAFELYDLDDDPGESRDLAAEGDDRLRDLMAVVRPWYAACREAAPEPAARETLDAATVDELKALGYIQ